MFSQRDDEKLGVRRREGSDDPGENLDVSWGREIGERDWEKGKR